MCEDLRAARRRAGLTAGEQQALAGPGIDVAKGTTLARTLEAASGDSPDAAAG